MYWCVVHKSFFVSACLFVCFQACAHRWKNIFYSRTDSQTHKLPNGVCYRYGNDLRHAQPIIPCYRGIYTHTHQSGFWVMLSHNWTFLEFSKFKPAICDFQCPGETLLPLAGNSKKATFLHQYVPYRLSAPGRHVLHHPPTVVT